jgi:hypothetical protein
MRTWIQVKTEYTRYLSEKRLKQVSRRMSALNKIERLLLSSYPSLLKGHALFALIDKDELKEKITHQKGAKINGAESQVINDFYKLAYPAQ